MSRGHGSAVLVALLIIVSSCVALAAQSKDAKVTVKLVELIQKKSYDAFSKELSSNPDMDVNQPTPSGRLPLVEAVKVKDLKLVDALLQYYATVNVKEPGTGASPIMLAFQSNLVEISRLLLAYGADPTITAKNGKKATDAMTSSAIKELYASWEKAGAMAFEDPPGTWRKAKSDDGVEYWFNVVAKEGRWNMPPSCAWQRVETQDGLPKYSNYVTGQTVYRTPAPLSWRKVRQAGGEPLWYNWAVNITQYEDPDEMPQYLLDEAVALTNVRWYNTKTGQFSWEDPKHASHWRTVSADNNEGTYYYNIATGETRWEVPEELAWTKEESEEHGPFWFNAHTGESQWEQPDSHAWVRQDHDL